MNATKRPLRAYKVVELATFIAAALLRQISRGSGRGGHQGGSPAGDPLRYTAVNEGRPYGDAEDTSFTLENAGQKRSSR